MKNPKRNYLDIVGTPNDDVIVGTDFADRIYGLGGNDVLIGGFGNDWITGGDGDDIFRAEDTGDLIEESVGGGFDRIYCEADYYYIRGGQEIELLAFSDPTSTRNVHLVGNELAQTIVAGAGNDILVGFGGNDVLVGLQGNDTYRVSNPGVVVLEEVGGGIDYIYVDPPAGSYTLGAGSEVEIVLTDGIVNNRALDFTGNEFANHLIGQAGRNVLIGGGGNDRLEGNRGNDIYRIDDMGDIIVEGTGTPNEVDAVYVAMNLSGYTLNPASIEILSAIDPSSAIAFNLTGNGNGNTIFGTAGVNILIGGGGFDTLAGGLGNDFYRVEEAGDNVIEAVGGGYDAVYAVGSYTLTAGQEIELLSALEPGATVALNLTGNGAANELYGNAGANILDGRTGDDLLFGLGGADTFAFSVSPDMGNVDTIADFLAGTDKIGVDDAVFNGVGTPGSFNANAFQVGTAAADADDRIIYDQATGRLFYDADGGGAGAAFQFALVSGAPVLAASDFAVI
jgi:serralysin